MGDDGVLRTERLRLRPWTTAPEDIARLTDIYGRVEIQRWVGGTPTVPPAVLVERWATVHALDDRYGCWAIEAPGAPGRLRRAAGTGLSRRTFSSDGSRRLAGLPR